MKICVKMYVLMSCTCWSFQHVSNSSTSKHLLLYIQVHSRSIWEDDSYLPHVFGISMDKSKPPSSDNDPLGSISTLQPSGPNSSFCRSAALPCRELPWDCCWRYDALLHGPMWFGSWRMTWAGARWASWMQPRHSDGHGFCSWSGSPSIDLAVSSMANIPLLEIPRYVIIRSFWRIKVNAS